MVDIIPCWSPYKKEFCVICRNIFWSKSADALKVCLEDLFNKLGNVHRVIVKNSDLTSESKCTYYAYIWFYSAVHAKRALSNNISIGNEPIKLCPAKTDSKLGPYKLLSFKAEDLLYNYFGCNYFSIKILSMNRDLECDPESITFVCRVKVESYGKLSVEGLGTGSAIPPIHSIEGTGKSYETARKYALQAAKSDAYSKLMIVELENGKAMLEVNTLRPDLFHPDLVESIQEVAELNSDPEELSDQELLEELSVSTLEHLLQV